MKTLLFTITRGAAALGFSLLLAAPGAHAQSAGKVRRMGEVLVTAGYGGAALKWPTFEEFLASYSALNRADLRTAPSLGTGTTQSLGIVAAGCCYLGYQRAAANSEAVFTNGARRRFEVRQGLCVLGIEPRFWIGRRVFLGPTGSMCAGTSRVNISYVYADGSESWGNDRRLVGQFAATTLTFMAGAKAGLNLGPLLVQVKADYMPGAKGTSGLGDLPGIGAGGSLPRHYDQFITSVTGPGGFSDPYSLVDDAVQYDLGMVRVAVEVGLRLNRAD